jgi:glycine/D-amino acid oxidase-like deaminating enzyme/nitrite reductase/ring-hydroxylating ferredoxin subunit
MTNRAPIDPAIPAELTPLWPTGGTRRSTFDPSVSADVVVVGAGITGIATALAARSAGLDVLVVEDRVIGAGATCLSTAKVAVLHGLRYSSLTDRHGPEVAARYAAGQRAGLEWLREHAGSSFEAASAATYATDDSSLRDVRAEVEAARAAGIAARFVDRVDVPFPTSGAVVVDDQASVDPRELLALLVDRFEGLGGRIVEGVRVLGVRDGRRGVTVRTAAGAVQARWVVVATGLPILDRGLLFARTEPRTSYCIAVRTSDPLPAEMLLSAGEPVRSLRTAPDPDRPGSRVLIVGGAGHKTGDGRSTVDCYEELCAWAADRYAVAEVPWRWSTEDFVPDDGLPFVGEIWPLPTSTLVATGYAKWGFTNGAAAALALVAHMTGAEAPPWSADWTPRRLDLRHGASEALKANGDVAVKLVGGWAGLVARGKAFPPTVTAEVDGQAHAVSAVCTHLGGVVRWNDADRCWDCPLHGSKFAPDGTLLHGPAVKDLATRGSVAG